MRIIRLGAWASRKPASSVLFERLGEPKPATVDHRHFGVLRPAHVEALELVPAR
jgi:hypothetical protein